MTSPNETQPSPRASDTAPTRGREWWRGAVIYQIYPRSFLDTTSDGVGDLRGVLAKLDYVADLGVDGFWLSPFFTSPMKDFGYDVSNYRDVDPIFGTLSDFDAVIEKAHKLGLKVIIDQVYSHTSDQHEWFHESRQNQTNAKTDWYVWADPKSDGAPPNNWQSVFGGAAWTWDGRRRQYYLHNFLTSQPDLNVHNLDVQNALLDVATFWLDRGVDGFRLDALNFAMHDPQLRDNPPAAPDGATKTRPFDYQEHVFNQSHANIPRFLERIRALTDEYDDVFTVAEVVGPDALDEMMAFTVSHKRLHSAYNFDFLYADKLTNATVKNAVGQWGGVPNIGWPSWAFSNHDAPRHITRWTDEKDHAQAAKLYAMLLMSLRGNAFIYQGEELGLPQADVPYDALQDPEAIANWPLTLGRDGARTPMPWRATDEYAGFTSGRPWLPLDGEHRALSVKSQSEDETSALQFFRSMIAIRKSNSSLRNGDLRFIDNANGDQDKGILAFHRSVVGQNALCVFNLSDEALEWNASCEEPFSIAISVGLDDSHKLAKRLPPLSGYVALTAD